MSPHLKPSIYQVDCKEAFDNSSQARPRKYEIIYKNVIGTIYAHIAAFYGLYLCFASMKWATIIFSFIILTAGQIGITAGAHRLWSHRSYKANLPLQIILVTFFTFSFQNSIIHWVRDHRLHHKYSDTDADPHNASRGFFYSHVGWLLVKKHPEVLKRGKLTEMSDIYSNPVLLFQKKYAVPLSVTISIILPILIPMFCWGETLNHAAHAFALRFVLSMHGILAINSFAHLWGTRPYDKNIRPVENKFVSLVAVGEGFHNYHHTFPWDYRAAELGSKLNLAAMFIDFFAWLGWAYDLKTVTPDMIEARAKKTGDGTGILFRSDKDLNENVKECKEIVHSEVKML